MGIEEATNPEADLRKLQTVINQKVYQEVEKQKQEFVTQVIDYHGGCIEGKRSFLQYVGLEDYLPSGGRATFTVEIEWRYGEEVDVDDIERDLRDVITDNHCVEDVNTTRTHYEEAG
jgi:hypothetical protein